MVMTITRISSLIQRGALAAAILAPALLPTSAAAQSDQPAYERYSEPSTTRRNRVKRDDAYRAPDDGPVLGTLNSSQASGGGSYEPPSNVAQGYGTQPPPPPYGAGAYGATPPPYGAPPSPYGASPPPYGASPAPSRPYPASPAAANDAYRPPQAAPYGDDRYGTPPPPAPEPYGNEAYRGPSGGGYGASGGGFGQPYSPPGSEGGYDGGRDGNSRRPYMSGDEGGRPPYRDERADGTYSSNEIMSAGHNFFGSISQGLASVIEYAFKRQGRPNGYILGEDAGGAFVAGLRYGEGRLYTKDAGSHKVYWQGPSLGYDVGAAGSKVMVLVYNLRDTNDIYERFGGVDGSAYVIGGVGLTFQKRDHVVLAPIRAGVGLRLGANVGYLKYTRHPTWNPF